MARHFAVVTISDSGKGLNQEEIDEINQPFDYDWGYWKNENRGIGLRYVKAMLESFYDGQTSLFVNSKKGSEPKLRSFFLSGNRKKKKRKTKRLHWKKIRWDRQMNVLIVDDDKLARKGLVAIMDWKKYGFE